MPVNSPRLIPIKKNRAARTLLGVLALHLTALSQPLYSAQPALNKSQMILKESQIALNGGQIVPNESRMIRNAASPAWLDAIVRLQVPGTRILNGRRRHHLEDCSATLVSAQPKRKANTLVTAWHCIEMYNDLSKALTVTFRTTSGKPMTREVYRLADGGGMHADWAILRILKAPPAGSVTSLFIDQGTADQSKPITMAGFSRDSGLGHGGEFLTFDPACRITVIERQATGTDCAAHKGASGGAVVQLSSSGAPLLTGVISEGNSENYSTFVPITKFRSVLQQHLGSALSL